MNLPDRQKFAEELFAECLRVSEAKGKDYSGEDDALANFKRNAERLGMTKYQAWGMFASKHIDSIFNSIKADPVHPQVESEPLRGRGVDVINYIMLFLALLSEDE